MNEARMYDPELVATKQSPAMLRDEWEPGSLRDEMERLHKMAESVGHGLKMLTERLGPICKASEVPVAEAVPQPQPLCDIGGELRRVSDILDSIDRDMYHLTSRVDLR